MNEIFQVHFVVGLWFPYNCDSTMLDQAKNEKQVSNREMHDYQSTGLRVSKCKTSLLHWRGIPCITELPFSARATLNFPVIEYQPYKQGSNASFVLQLHISKLLLSWYGKFLRRNTNHPVVDLELHFSWGAFSSYSFAKRSLAMSNPIFQDLAYIVLHIVQCF